MVTTDKVTVTEFAPHIGKTTTDYKENDMGVIKVEHPNGFLGILYGESSLVVYDEDGHEILHTGNRNIDTEAELYELLEGMPEFVEIMADIVLEDDDDSNT